MAVPTLWAIGELALGIKGGLIPDLTLQSETWVVLGVLPLLAGGIAMLTARMTVRRQLARML
jgi:cell division transport system permease protein